MPQQQAQWLILLLSPAFVVLCQQVPAPGLSAESPRVPPTGCPAMCGNVAIPYPFGLSEGCSWDQSFTLSCNNSISPPAPFYGNLEVIDITLETGELRVFSAVSRICFNSSTDVSSRLRWKFDFAGSPFLVKSGRNEFTGIGCYTRALLRGKQDNSYFSGCVTTCTSLDEAASAGNSNGCTGLGCCQMLTPSNLDMIRVSWGYQPTNRAWNYTPCSYAMVAQKGWYKFKLSDLNSTGDKAYDVQVGERSAPLVLDWAINISRDGACVSAHSSRVVVRDGQGYLCNCSQGYAGNPYVKDGCININECQDVRSNRCPSGSKCIDTEGSYRCQCKLGRRGNECRPIFPATAAALLATFVANLLLGLLVWSFYKDHKRRMQRAFFDKNGGRILKGVDINIFSEDDLKKMTNQYNTPIGRGAFGTVFLGTFDRQQVAVKRCIVQNSNLHGGHELQGGGDAFVNEITFQFRISHPNLVRLVGCCLETIVPVLVFEYIRGGNLYNLLHVARQKVLPLKTRLNIAIGSAEALAYMHSHGGDHNHIHGDVKSANILLDDNLMPKVSDFGSSKLLSIDMYARAVAADMSYIDPIYMKTGRFLAKSDVYSFGMVLLELVTRQTVKYGKNKINCLSVDFVKYCKEKGNGREMYDRDILSHGDVQCHHCMGSLDKVAALAVRCLKEDVDERPTMAEVVDELKQAVEALDRCLQQQATLSVAYGASWFEAR